LKDLLPLIARLEKGDLSISDLNYGYLSKVVTNAIRRRAIDLRSEIWSGRELIDSAPSRIRKKRRRSAGAAAPSTGLDQLLEAFRHNIDKNRVFDARRKLKDGRTGSGGSGGTERLAEDVAQSVASYELRAAVIIAVANLADYDKEQHDVISRLYFHSGDSTPTYASIAEDLDLTLKQVRKRHEDGLRYIEAELERQ
jgi:DNA-directed RNA polymerase specialized sigma24 family protein